MLLFFSIDHKSRLFMYQLYFHHYHVLVSMTSVELMEIYRLILNLPHLKTFQRVIVYQLLLINQVQLYIM